MSTLRSALFVSLSLSAAGCGGVSPPASDAGTRDAPASARDGAAESDARTALDATLADDAAAPPDDAALPADDAAIVVADDAWSCVPTTSCASMGFSCGAATDDCGHPLDCGGCPDAMTCGADHQCLSSCIPTQGSGMGGGTCGGLDQAYTGRGINVGYFPFRVRAPISLYSGDYDGAPDATFARGPGSAGVQLAVFPAGAYVGLSSAGPWYDPPSGDCSPGTMTCGDPGRSACASSSPPMRPSQSGFVWGYGYHGATHLQGWIPADFTRLVYAGDDPSHPCALGPAGLDYEVASACGRPTHCSGGSPSCGDTNPCSEGADDCGRCSAQSGGALTPSRWRRTVSRPSAHTCTQRTPPDPSVRCIANGGDPDFFFVYPFGAYLYWAQNSTTKAWIHYGDRVQAYYHTRDSSGVLWDFVEVLSSGAPTLTPPSDGAGASSGHPCLHGGTCGWVQDVFLAP